MNSTDDQAVVPFFSLERESFLEYDLTKVVHSLVNPVKKIVGVISTLPVHGRHAPPFGTTPRWPTRRGTKRRGVPPMNRKCADYTDDFLHGINERVDDLSQVVFEKTFPLEREEGDHRLIVGTVHRREASRR